MKHISFKQLKNTARLLGIALVAGGLALPVPPPAYAETIIRVTTTEDEINGDGDCSLREAILAANNNRVFDGWGCQPGSREGQDTIILPPGDFVLTLKGANEEFAITGDLDITSIWGPLVIVGAGVDATRISGADDRVFDVVDQASLLITALLIRDGAAGTAGGGGIRNRGSLEVDFVYLVDNSAERGGAIENRGKLFLLRSTLLYNQARYGGGALLNQDAAVVDRSTLHHNSAGAHSGGGISNAGELTVLNSTIDFNHAGLEGGGIANSFGTVTINNSTVVINEANSWGYDPDLGVGGGISNSKYGTLTIRNSIVANNIILKGGQGPDCAGALTSQGYNLITNTAGCSIGGVTTGNVLGQDPLLGPLDNNGGPTSSRMPEPASPAIDAANPALVGSDNNACIEFDLRKLDRPQDGDGDGMVRCDIGAVERRSVSTP